MRSLLVVEFEVSIDRAESFLDGLNLTNKARDEVGLGSINAPYHNMFFNKERFLSWLPEFFHLVDMSELCGESRADFPGENFLSSHYFMSRVVYPLITQREVMRNTEIVKFFSYLPPKGNYAPNQCYILRKVGGEDQAN